MRRRLQPFVGLAIIWLCWIGVVVLTMAGIWAGWIAPRLDPTWPTVAAMRVSLNASTQSPSIFLAADLTTLGVIVAIIIGYNVAAFQVAAQVLSLTLVRSILYTLLPFLGLWFAATFIAMVYLLTPPPVAGDLYHVACWFGATVFALIGYLVALPTRLSGDYEANWSVRDLRGIAIAEWESTDGFTVLQAGINSAVGKADVSTLRTLVLPLARFLSGRCDRQAEQHPGYNRARFYALRDLLAGCAPFISSAPNAIWYVLGSLESGLMLQAAALGLPPSLQHSTLFDDGIPTGLAAPQNIVALWAGLRHALCRPGVQGMPYLRRYWTEHTDWPSTDLRSVAKVAEILVFLHNSCWQAMRASTLSPSEVADQCADLLVDVYRYLWQYLPTEPRSGLRSKAEFTQKASNLMAAVHLRAHANWPADQTAALATLDNAYTLYKARLDDHISPIVIARQQSASNSLSQAEVEVSRTHSDKG